ncbi:(2Fe-2S) ferredoxin domain-containing protein [Lacibacterium aquatile]|uniref:(2Fe-2S) ferredoxin domain-containing protein n=1 Tax=Lacibacterium aquatile TaxID=1168082 RepID=A0ABW5DL72_9PROT
MTASVTLMVCVNRRFGPTTPSCAGRGSERLADQLTAMIAERALDVRIERSACQGRCAFGPAMRRLPQLEIFLQVTDADLANIVDSCAALPSQKVAENDDLPPPI